MTLTEKERRLVRLFAATVLGRWSEVRALRAGAPAGEPDREWREALLQTHLFAGIPRLVEAYEVLERAGGLGAPEREEVLGEPDLPARGGALFDRIYAARAPAVRDRLASFHPDLAAWIQGHAYGRVLTRPGLAPDRRELLAVAALAAIGQDRQLASHARGALRCGATPAEVRAVLDEIQDLSDPAHLERARAVVERFVTADG